MTDVRESREEGDAETSPTQPREHGARRPIVRREYYSIGEVCDLVDLKPHVLRYWETQFPELSPPKNRAGNRVYQRKEIELILLVRDLLYRDKYTIEGARQQLETLRKGGELQEQARRAAESALPESLRQELEQLLMLLTQPAAENA